MYTWRFAFSLVLLTWLGLAEAPAAENEAIRRAIERGVAALKDMRPERTAERSHQTGIAALIGLTLLECNVPANDAAIQKNLVLVRTASPELNHTYSLSLAIMFLDRYGDAGDLPLLYAMAVRLLAGQNSNGGWSYTCPRPPSGEVQSLNSWLRERGDNPRPIPLPREPKPLPKEVQDQIDALAKAPARKDGDDFQKLGDNSNT